MGRVFPPLVSALALGLTASAGARTLDLQRYRPAPSGEVILAMDRPDVARHLEAGGGVACSVADDPLLLSSDSGAVAALVDEHTSCDLLASMGLLGWAQVGVALPVTLAMEGADTGGLEGGQGGGMGDVRLSAKAALAGEDRPLRAGIAFAAQLPTGDEGSYRGDGSFGGGVDALGAYRFGRWDVAARAGVRFREADPSLPGLSAGDEVGYGLGAVWEVGEGLGLSLGAELDGSTALDSSFGDTEESAAEARLGVRWRPVPSWTVSVGGGAPVQNGVGTPRFRVIFGLHFMPREVDSDGDGILDRVDKCPEEPEDKDGHQDADGCPDPDNDLDGVADARDRCPEEPEDKDGFRDDDGCPDEDNDGDGVIDSADDCPLLAEDRDGHDDFDGCPDDDNDGDGLVDAKDACPDAAEDMDGHNDSDGCPDDDNDLDGQEDGIDRCPDKPETYNGITDSDGCPEEGEVKALLALEADQIRLHSPILFGRGAPEPKESSRPLLQAVADLLIAHTGILLVRVEMHQHPGRKSAEFYKEISQSRAGVVKAILVEAGVDEGRLEAVGMGSERPVGKRPAENNRLELIVVDRVGSEG